MLIENLQKAIGRHVRWKKFNHRTGIDEIIDGKLIDAGIADKICNIEYAVIIDDQGTQWKTHASCVKEILP